LNLDLKGEMKMRNYVVNSYQCSNKRGFTIKTILFLILILTISILLSLFIVQEVKSNAQIQFKKIQVDKGDSLWLIVRRNYSPKIDIRKKIYQIKKLNNLASVNLKPGQIIKIPKK
jgi:LysM repeat protein